MLKWGNTEVTAVKWGTTNVTVVKWGSTVVFPTNNGYDINSNTFVAPIAGGLYGYTAHSTGTQDRIAAAAYTKTGSTTSSSITLPAYVSVNKLTSAQWKACKQIRWVIKCIVYLYSTQALDNTVYFASNVGVFLGFNPNNNNNNPTPSVNNLNTNYTAITKWCSLSMSTSAATYNTFRSSIGIGGSNGATYITSTNSSGNQVILTGNTTNIVDAWNFPFDAYFALYIAFDTTGCPGSGAAKYFRVELQSLEFLTSIKY